MSLIRPIGQLVACSPLIGQWANEGPLIGHLPQCLREAPDGGELDGPDLLGAVHHGGSQPGLQRLGEVPDGLGQRGRDGPQHLRDQDLDQSLVKSKISLLQIYLEFKDSYGYDWHFRGNLESDGSKCQGVASQTTS